jgi:hypothetical protein
MTRGPADLLAGAGPVLGKQRDSPGGLEATRPKQFRFAIQHYQNAAAERCCSQVSTDSDAAGRGERVELQRRVLLDGGDPGVAEEVSPAADLAQNPDSDFRTPRLSVRASGRFGRGVSRLSAEVSERDPKWPYALGCNMQRAVGGLGA